jgi:hypothetical protein
VVTQAPIAVSIVAGADPPRALPMHSLTFFPGSPFARIARILVAEWALPVEVVPAAFPGDDDLFEATPLGQVPALFPPGGEPVLTTFLVLEALWAMAGSPDSAYRATA